MAKLKVLVAEDDPTMVNLLKTLLKMEGFNVIALNGDENVVKAFGDHCPDVLLMDVHLSRQNGLEILDSIRASPGGCNARIIMTSGLDVKDDCMKRGADGFILKPFMPDDLIQMLKGK
jgi:CheY-like chemotaxis protein